MSGLMARSSGSHSLSRRFCLSLLAFVAVVVSVLAVALVAVGPASASETTTSGGAATVAVALTQVSEVANTATTLVPTTIALTTVAPSTTSTTEASEPAGPMVEYSAEELEFVRLLNEYRASEGLGPLMLSDTLTVACDRHTSDMVKYDFINHFTGYYRDSNGRDLPLEGTYSDYFATGANPMERMVACGYDFRTTMGENLAAGQPTPAEALEGLKSSPTHNANLLHPDFKVLGIAVAHDADTEWGHYWTMDFGGYVDTTAHAVATMVASLD